VLNPTTGQPFGDIGAWEYIADLIESGQTLDETPQDDNVTAYVMHVQLPDGPLYIKVRLGSGYILGRSFHYASKVTPS
jgi:hypothetical protein